MKNPFTTTFSKIPDSTYIYTEQVETILENFSYSEPSESVYKITGVRGSGKTVLLAKVEKELENAGDGKKEWIICRLSPARDMLQQLAALLLKEGFGGGKGSNRSFNISANVMGTGGGIGIGALEKASYLDVGIELDGMLKKATADHKKILVGVDEVSKTSEMIEFTSEFGKWLRAGYAIYLVCTGLYENIEQLYNVKNLTFFRRATTIKTEPLSPVRMAETYRNELGIDSSMAKRLSELTKGYAYAFQELGVLYFQKKKEDELEKIIERLRLELFSYAYEKIWEELSLEDKTLVRLITEKEEYSREEVLNKMEKPGNYSMYRDRLLRRGLISARHGYISLTLPMFGEYVREYCC